MSFKQLRFTFIALLFFTLAIAALSGCASTKEIDWGEQQDIYDTCVRVYAANGVPMYHLNHTHSRDKFASPGRKRDNLRRDIITNNCEAIYRRVVGD